MKFRVERDALADAVAWTAKSLPSRPSVPVLAGVLLRVGDNRLEVSGFDYEVSSQVTVDVHADADMSVAALVPAKTLDDTAKTLGPLGGQVTIALARGGVGEGMIGFAGGTRRTTSRLLDGDFPKVRSLRPDTHSAQAKVPVSALAEVVKRVSLVAERATPVRLGFSEDGLVVEAG